LRVLLADATLAVKSDGEDRANRHAGRLRGTMKLVANLFAVLLVLLAAQTASARCA
jgi:hypothetical protein